MDLFPHDAVRKEQDLLVGAIRDIIAIGGILVAHAPTGLGKTAASLAPALEYGLTAGKTVIFMTSRLTQHRLALETVRRIRERHGANVTAVDLLGKQHFCLQEGAQGMPGKEFAEYCKAMREDGLCAHYERLKTGEHLSSHTKGALIQLGGGAHEASTVKDAGTAHGVCPYELTMLLAKDANVIITDYSYLFNPRIRSGFLHRIGKTLQDCILVVDEGHNLPERVKEIASDRISSTTLKRAMRELEKTGEKDHLHHLKQATELLDRLSTGVQEERHLRADEITQGMERICSLQELLPDLDHVATVIREEGNGSSCGALSAFLRAWPDEHEGYTRILKIKGEEGRRAVVIEHRCLDPAVVTQDVLRGAHSAIVMSGTLTPVRMYAAVLGVPDAQTLSLASPFPDTHRLTLVVPSGTTRFQQRSDAMYRELAAMCERLVEAIPGNVACFFPSYAVMREVQRSFHPGKTTFTEHPDLTKEERDGMIDRFRGYKNAGAVLLGVMGGSFSEGIDLPGEELRGVVVIGLPLGRPDLETKALIAHYDQKFGKGWEYGYTFPAFNKTLQSAGRCIRTEHDRGVLVFVDERYAWPSYQQCFPKEWEIVVTKEPEPRIKRFFEVS